MKAQSENQHAEIASTAYGRVLELEEEEPILEEGLDIEDASAEPLEQETVFGAEEEPAITTTTTTSVANTNVTEINAPRTNVACTPLPRPSFVSRYFSKCASNASAVQIPAPPPSRASNASGGFSFDLPPPPPPIPGSISPRLTGKFALPSAAIETNRQDEDEWAGAPIIDVHKPVPSLDWDSYGAPSCLWPETTITTNDNDDDDEEIEMPESFLDNDVDEGDLGSPTEDENEDAGADGPETTTPKTFDCEDAQDQFEDIPL